MWPTPSDASPLPATRANSSRLAWSTSSSDSMTMRVSGDSAVRSWRSRSWIIASILATSCRAWPEVVASSRARASTRDARWMAAMRSTWAARSPSVVCGPKRRGRPFLISAFRAVPRALSMLLGSECRRRLVVEIDAALSLCCHNSYLEPVEPERRELAARHRFVHEHERDLGDWLGEDL